MRAWRNVLLRFGMVNVPLSLAPAARSGAEVEAHRYAGGERVKQAWTLDGETILQPDEIRKAYETPGGLVEIEAPEIPGDNGLEIEGLVPFSTISPAAYDTTYAAFPGKGGERSYAALSAVLEDRPGAALVGRLRVTDRPRDCAVVFDPETEALLVVVLHYAAKVRYSEIRAAAERAGAAKPEDVTAAETWAERFQRWHALKPSSIRFRPRSFRRSGIPWTRLSGPH